MPVLWTSQSGGASAGDGGVKDSSPRNNIGSGPGKNGGL